ncbi:ABC-type transporter, periplasmic subunit [Rhodothermus marinus SG0.5JP17-172]|mgnify:FL=1|uniref:cobalamin-binding protein n=1 Tax=Rhodothermus marinus TaxID=29549 RepID=UPI000223D997|nr:cobalamin-binding protein [Rhodothermus marinus]AEN72959.1 ABC-type transporter, periplasmic subunit [Rhodothermus marinus SG0.5JP17-172]
MRIISLLPAATEWVCAFGGREALVGRSHVCDYPPEVVDLPVLTRPRVDAQGTSAEIDRQVRAVWEEGKSLYEIDWAQLHALQPDLILTQAQCPVCAVSASELEAGLADWPGSPPRLFTMAPQTLKQVLDSALALGRAIGRTQEAMSYLARAEKRLRQLRDFLGLRRRMEGVPLPRVVCIEWLDPLIVAGHWMPDVVELAGGQPVLTESGHPSRTISWAELQEVDPDVLLLMPCGFSVAQTARELAALSQRPEWQALRAVQEGRVFVLDGHAYFNRPGPRLYRSIELVAVCLHPDRLSPELLDVQPWELQTLEAALA